MTKAELVTLLKSKGQWDVHRRTPEWQQAFDKHNAERPMNKLQSNCGACYPKLKTWLLS